MARLATSCQPPFGRAAFAEMSRELKVFLQPDSVERLRYAYVQGDPVNHHDPTGLLTKEWGVDFSQNTRAEWVTPDEITRDGSTETPENYVEVGPSPAPTSPAETSRQGDRTGLQNEQAGSPGDFQTLESQSAMKNANTVTVYFSPSARTGVIVTNVSGEETSSALSARSGSSNYAPLDSGKYTTSWASLRNRSNGGGDPNVGMQDEVGFGWSLDLVQAPGNSTTRTRLRIHPDGDGTGNGNYNNGTEGCIGVNTANSQEFLPRMYGSLQAVGRSDATVRVLP